MRLRCAACRSRFSARREACPSCGHRRPGSAGPARETQTLGPLQPGGIVVPLLVAGFLATVWIGTVAVTTPWLPGSSAETQAALEEPRGEAEAVEFAFTRLSEHQAANLTAEQREAREHYNPERLRSLFDSFDRDGNGELEWTEARAFYEWVEANNQYRHDDENATAEIPGTPVGDGRPGTDYQQSPLETFDEGMGDCEDTSTLHVAFHRYWGNTAYQALINTEAAGGIDHAAAIVQVDGDLEQREEPEAGFHTYEFGPDNEHGVEPGTYVIVDNTYSDTFAAIDGDVAPGSFQVQDAETLPQALQRSDDWRG